MSLLQTSIRPQCAQCRLAQQIRHASLLRRPKRPYTFTQIITLSDGSTFLHRTTSPAPIHQSKKDTKNSPLWNPSSQQLFNVEEDEAGRLKRFRRRFGRGFDAEALESEQDAREGEEGFDSTQQEESLMDLIGGYGKEVEKTDEAARTGETSAKSVKSKRSDK